MDIPSLDLVLSPDGRTVTVTIPGTWWVTAMEPAFVLDDEDNETRLLGTKITLAKAVEES